MGAPRKDIVNVEVTRYYHCISQCVRQAMLCGGERQHRKGWIANRLRELTSAFAIGVVGHAPMDNHLHVVVRLEPERALVWSDEEVVRRWLTLYQPKKKIDQDDPDAVAAYIAEVVKDADLVAEYRSRLADLGWFMKSLKEPLARMANKEDGCKGAFWAARYKSIALLDEEAVVAVCAYVDLNPVAAGLARLPERSRFTSLLARITHIRGKKQGWETLIAARDKATAATRTALARLEEDLWLSPVEDRRSQGASRGGMSEHLTLASYLMLVDYTSRLLRKGKARVKSTERSVFERLGSTAERWGQRMQRLFSKPIPYGTYFATDRNRLRELAQRKGTQRLANLAGCRV